MRLHDLNPTWVKHRRKRLGAGESSAWQDLEKATRVRARSGGTIRRDPGGQMPCTATSQTGLNNAAFKTVTASSILMIENRFKDGAAINGIPSGPDWCAPARRHATLGRGEVRKIPISKSTAPASPPGKIEKAGGHRCQGKAHSGAQK
jgi:hypothetical protein